PRSHAKSQCRKAARNGHEIRFNGFKERAFHPFSVIRYLLKQESPFFRGFAPFASSREKERSNFTFRSKSPSPASARTAAARAASGRAARQAASPCCRTREVRA